MKHIADIDRPYQCRYFFYEKFLLMVFKTIQFPKRYSSKQLRIVYKVEICSQSNCIFFFSFVFLFMYSFLQPFLNFLINYMQKKKKTRNNILSLICCSSCLSPSSFPFTQKCDFRRKATVDFIPSLTILQMKNNVLQEEVQIFPPKQQITLVIYKRLKSIFPLDLIIYQFNSHQQGVVLLDAFYPGSENYSVACTPDLYSSCYFIDLW